MKPGLRAITRVKSVDGLGESLRKSTILNRRTFYITRVCSERCLVLNKVKVIVVVCQSLINNR